MRNKIMNYVWSWNNQDDTLSGVRKWVVEKFSLEYNFLRNFTKTLINFG